MAHYLAGNLEGDTAESKLSRALSAVERLQLSRAIEGRVVREMKVGPLRPSHVFVPDDTYAGAGWTPRDSDRLVSGGGDHCRLILPVRIDAARAVLRLNGSFKAASAEPLQLCVNDRTVKAHVETTDALFELTAKLGRKVIGKGSGPISVDLEIDDTPQHTHSGGKDLDLALEHWSVALS
jgi:hypothetical protein